MKERARRRSGAHAVSHRYDAPMPIDHHPFGELLDAVAAKSPTPGGGAVTAAVGALGSALGSMVVNYTVGKKAYAAHEGELQQALVTLANARTLLLQLAGEDELAYGELNALMRLPETDPRRADLPAVAATATQVPMAVIATCTDLLRLFQRLAGITNPMLRSDLAIGAILAEAAARASRLNAVINLPLLATDADREAVEHELSGLLAVAADLARAVETACA